MIRLKELREARHWNMKQAADFLNKPYTTYVNHEKEYREPNSEDLIAYSKAYGVTIDYLICRTDDPTGYNDHFVMQPVEKDTLNQLYSSLEYDHVGVRLLQQYRSLSFEGQLKVDKYIEDLIATGLYKRDTDSKVG